MSGENVGGGSYVPFGSPLCPISPSQVPRLSEDTESPVSENASSRQFVNRGSQPLRDGPKPFVLLRHLYQVAKSSRKRHCAYIQASYTTHKINKPQRRSQPVLLADEDLMFLFNQ
jgi:hypothetical protein